MNVTTLPEQDTFRTQPLRGLPEAAKVDRKTRTIYGAKAIEFGVLNEGDARAWKVDDTTMSQLVAMVNQRTQGAKMRFAHPNMSRDGMGRHLGRAVNARIETPENGAAYVAVDARLHEAATRSPQGNLAAHVLDLAEQAPEDFGLSIAPMLDREAMEKIEPDENGYVPIRLKALRAIDFVDEPAATRGGLFSLDSDSLADLPAQASDLLDTFFADSPADVIRARFGEFLTTYLTNRGDEPMATETKPVVAPIPGTVTHISKEQSDELHALSVQQAAADKLERRAQVTALCRLAKVDDATRDDMLAAGFDGKRAQEWLSTSGFLSGQNPPIAEGVVDPSNKPSPTKEDAFGKEWDAGKDIFQRQGVTREDYVKSRLKD